jgi:hypothetical protein
LSFVWSQDRRRPQFGIFIVKYVMTVTGFVVLQSVNDKACGYCSIFKTNNENFEPSPKDF